MTKDDHIKSVTKAYLDGVGVQYQSGVGLWHTIDYNFTTFIMDLLNTPFRFRVKPKTVDVYSRRCLIMFYGKHSIAVCNYVSTHEKNWEQSTDFVKWIEDKQTMEVEI